VLGEAGISYAGPNALARARLAPKSSRAMRLSAPDCASASTPWAASTFGVLGAEASRRNARRPKSASVCRAERAPRTGRALAR